MAFFQPEAFLAQLVEHPPCKRKVRGSIPRGGISLFLFFSMNPVFVTRVTRFSMYPVRSAGILARKSSFIRRDFRSFLAGQRAAKSRHSAIPGSKQLFTSGFRREFASSGSSFNLPTRTFTFFALSSMGLVGCFYVISYSLQVSCCRFDKE